MKIAALFLMLLTMPAWGGQAEAESAVARILFDADIENASFKVRGDGFVDILFGAAVSDADYSRLIEKLRADPNIKGVLPEKSNTNYCTIK